MVCCHGYELTDGHENAFMVDTNRITFGRGCLDELGTAARELAMTRVVLFTDRRVADTEHVERAQASLQAAGIDVARYDDVRVEPTNTSFEAATTFAKGGSFDGYVSVGGGSVIDTAKAANLYATHPASFESYVNKPVGAGAPVPGPLRPHIACPTTSGTGSECTGIAVFDHLPLEAKTGIASPHLRPSRALVDPNTTRTLPAEVVASSGFDVLCHALESYTARPFTARTKGPRPMSQGRNPWSDLGSREAIALCGRYLVAATQGEEVAREAMMWAATLAGIAFGNAGVHIPHAMAYAVAGQVKDYRPTGYPSSEAMVPHGVSVVLNAPAAFRATAPTDHARHAEAAHLLELQRPLDEALAEMMRAVDLPNGLGGVGYGPADVPRLVEGSIVQRRLLDNAPIEVTPDVLGGIFEDAMRCWA